jgi:hypothetical protein
MKNENEIENILFDVNRNENVKEKKTFIFCILYTPSPFQIHLIDMLLSVKARKKNLYQFQWC